MNKPNRHDMDFFHGISSLTFLHHGDRIPNPDIIALNKDRHLLGIYGDEGYKLKKNESKYFINDVNGVIITQEFALKPLYDRKKCLLHNTKQRKHESVFKFSDFSSHRSEIEKHRKKIRRQDRWIHAKGKKIHVDGIDTYLIYNNKTGDFKIVNQGLWNWHRHKRLYTVSMKDNKECGMYLGIYIAERMLSKVFKNCERMKPNNPGFDFFCAQRFKIEVKISTRHYHGKWGAYNWGFNVTNTEISDYHIFLAMDSRENLNPEHIWLIPTKDLKGSTGESITPNTLDKWQKYELTNKLDQVISCCNIMKE